MADWMHKEATWVAGIHTSSDWEGNPSGWKQGPLFPEWLDERCKGGWEVFKISRDFNGPSGTWCIFRRLA